MDKRAFIARRAAAYFQPGDVVNLGIGIPGLCADYAAPGVMFHTENGLLGVGPQAEGLQKVESFCNATAMEFVPVPGASAFDTALSFGLIRGGRLDATVLGGLQVSQGGDLANWASPGRAFGMGGAMDLVSGARRVIVAMEHTTPKGEAKIVPACTLPYTGRACVDHIVTELCVMDVTPAGLVLRELAPGCTVEQVRARTAAPFTVAPDLGEMT